MTPVFKPSATALEFVPRQVRSFLSPLSHIFTVLVAYRSENSSRVVSMDIVPLSSPDDATDKNHAHLNIARPPLETNGIVW